MPVVTTSLTVSFVTDSQSSGQNIFQCEIEADSTTQFNKGKTSFVPGDTAYISLFKGSAVTGVTVESTAGGVSLAALSQVISREEVLTFAKESEASVALPVYAVESYEWYGNDLGAITYVPETNSFRVATSDSLGVLKIKYKTLADIYALSGASVPQALVLFSGVTP